MPMNKQERHRQMKAFDTAVAPSDAILSKQALNNISSMPKRIRQEVMKFKRMLSRLSPVTDLDKRTAFFNAISAETDGMLMLHDLGELFDSSIALVNDYRDPEIDTVVGPFTDANVTYYEANGVSD